VCAVVTAARTCYRYRLTRGGAAKEQEHPTHNTTHHTKTHSNKKCTSTSPKNKRPSARISNAEYPEHRAPHPGLLATTTLGARGVWHTYGVWSARVVERRRCRGVTGAQRPTLRPVIANPPGIRELCFVVPASCCTLRRRTSLCARLLSRSPAPGPTGSPEVHRCVTALEAKVCGWTRRRH